MIAGIRKQKLTLITWVYLFLLAYIVAALVWWFISLETQNHKMFDLKLAEIKKDDPAYEQKLAIIADERQRKTAQYIGEGSIFLILILVGAVFVYRATRKQIKLSQQQQNFMMAVTHELKTPIAITQLNLETLQKRKLDEAQQQKLLTVAIQETNRLNILTNNILIASQLEAGKYSLNNQQVDISQLVTQIANEFTSRFTKRSFKVEVTPGLFVWGENMLLQLLLNNLIENAIKYSPTPAPVSISLNQQNNQIVLTIADEGMGIADAEKKKIFEKFYRSGNEATRTTKGTGLGLYLCKRIVQDHKAQILIKDNLPQGSIFTVILQSI
ncbi:sensor histidine kinase [Limnovirga soli]|uniref:histidine kinase n=1 Tax=Limnovirga soli TaxID=2656915 RepID=A0A8J8FKC5_9BACT|nr:ATP-binding protein [Limnovirga soli]NNV57914.1 two-component sensor histidine kinase [Limnovirga soli]